MTKERRIKKEVRKRRSFKSATFGLYIILRPTGIKLLLQQFLLKYLFSTCSNIQHIHAFYETG